MVNYIFSTVGVFIEHSKFMLLTQKKTLRRDSDKDFLGDKECLYQKYYWGKAEFCQKSTIRFTCCDYQAGEQHYRENDSRSLL